MTTTPARASHATRNARDGYAARVTDPVDAYDTALAATAAAHIPDLVAHVRRLEAAEDAVEAARLERDRAIWAAADAGMTAAQIVRALEAEMGRLPMSKSGLRHIIGRART